MALSLYAQPTDPPAATDTLYALPEIVVTASRQSESVQSVPMSIAVFDRHELQRTAVAQLDELTFRAPNVNIFQTRSSSSTGAMFIRGIGQEDFVFTVDAGVGTYLDDVLLPRSQGSLLDVYDIERIEILRGPQGTLYGRNTIAGAVKYFSAQPSPERSAQLELASGNYGRMDGRGSLNVPLAGGRLLSRVSLVSLNRRGSEYNVINGEHLNGKQTLAARGALLWTPSARWDLNWRVDDLRERPSLHVGALLRPQTTALDYSDMLAGRTVTIVPNSDPFKVRSNVENRNDIDSWGTALTANWKLADSVALKSITAYRQLAENTRFDFDATEARSADVFILHDHYQFTEDIQHNVRRGRLNLVSGVFAFREYDNEMDGTDALAKGYSMDAHYDQQVTSYALYSQASERVWSSWSVTLGARMTWEEKYFNRQSERHPADSTRADGNLFGGYGNGPGGRPPSQYPGNGIPLTNIRDAHADWKAFTPRAGVDFRPARNALVFASVARGFKSGGFNGRATEASNPRQRDPYQPEYVWTYEVGAKTDWLGSRLRANATLFWNDYRDLQLSSFSSVDSDHDGVNETFLPLFTNAGRARTRGFELELASRPWEGGTVSVGVGYTDAKYLVYRERNVDLSGVRDMPNTPKWTATADVSHMRGLIHSVYVLEVGATVDYQGARFLTVSNLPDLKQSAYGLVHAFITLAHRRLGWSLSLNGKNLFDQRCLVSGLDASSPPFGIVTGFYGEPRTLIVTLTKRF